MPVKKRPLTKAGTPRKRKGVKLKPTELRAQDLLVSSPDDATAELAERVNSDGGQVLAIYREPLGGHEQILAALPIDKVEPTPFQRDVSDSHVRKLTLAMDKTRRYLDPVIAVYMNGKYLTPNGNHRLTALQELGSKTIIALLIPDPAVAFQILALNIEKAHNLREKALEVKQMYDELLRLEPKTKESQYSLEFEEAQFITLGFAYKLRPRISGGAYQPALKKVDDFLAETLKNAVEIREERATLLLELDDAVGEAVEQLKEHGFESPYLKPFVVARINPLRFMKGDLPSFEELIETMIRRARKMDASKIKTADLAKSGGIIDE